MPKRLIDRVLEIAFRVMPRALTNFSVLPVLHVERLHDDQAFERTLEFFRDYLRASGHKAIATVIPPIAPFLSKVLETSSFCVDAYEDRIRQLAEVSEIGLHGHYVRDVDGLALVHNYWNEREIVIPQMTAELHWLESRGLMKRRIYSGGWWYCDRMIAEALVTLDIEFDFSFSTSHFSRSPLSYRKERRVRQSKAWQGRDRRQGPGRLWALTGICNAGPSFAVPRRLLQNFWRQWLRRSTIMASLYGHDWDMDPVAARTMLAQLSRIGVGLGGLPAKTVKTVLESTTTSSAENA